MVDIILAVSGQMYRKNNLFPIEDSIRKKETLQKFDREFVILARNVYKTNDKRSDIKKEINLYTKSELIEEKSYE